MEWDSAVLSQGADGRPPSNRAIILLPLVLYLLLPAKATAQQSGTIRVLFIGNSYTYFNDLPEIFAKLAEAGHQGKIEARMIAPGGWRLLDDGKWDFVELQAEKWAAHIREKGATPVFFLTWARKSVPEDQPALSYAYVSAAKETRSLVAPVGMAWDALRHEQPSFALF